MVGVVGDDDAGAAGRGAGDAEGEVVRLGPGAGEHHVGEFGREKGEEALGIVEDAVVQIAGVGGKDGGLLGHRCTTRGWQCPTEATLL